MNTLEIELPDPAATTALAEALARALDGGLVVLLSGELGAGKTHLVRALLTALGVGGRIKSPTYSLVESYALPTGTAWHLDLYRIADPGELAWLGLDALSEPAALVLVEWPEHGEGALPPPDLRVRLVHAGGGRRASLQAASPRGARVLARLGECAGGLAGAG
ncbi:tRNA (adenosine(37)-N6)-threonylcarbamoyltransferase complex ATPase subunit type 1 TsaE [Aerosticca soli]|uniref:tRNA threonylcarbamoyladenosine biosynthesis protein TsaE n=1 Tax=Aerosticca soli TaxID=2010829 RepID=A0A2Z6E705_9GAMM|nr:tRNA (adenosine(37)-N6)-threonylcarbamoyltransferase complex ATPase subunit type 1 TsaE [Aerosticca soli]BBD80464.1 TsaE protein, required for threonylcarbamoyladenosine t(6)A37 formation in tRNA [Aerosticca soli]